MSTNQLYHTLIEWMLQLRPGERITRMRNLVWMMIGMYASQSVHLSKMAWVIPGKAQAQSTYRRLRRFLANSAVKVHEWYIPIARQWIVSQAQTTGEVRLIIDGTQTGFGFQLLMVALAFRRRAVPLAWTSIAKSQGKGRNTASSHVALLRQIYPLVPPGTPVLVVGDSEFGDVPVLQQLEAWGWHYVLRQRGVIQVKLPHTSCWQNFQDLVTATGQVVWVKNAWVTLKYGHVTHLCAYWKPGEDDPWLLVTDLPTPQAALRAYRRRMWIEEMFGDFKSNGMNLDSTHVRIPEHLERLTLVAALLLCWCISTGYHVIKNGWRASVDRADRRDLSIFQIGLRFLQRRMANDCPFPIHLCPILPKLSGG